MKLLASIRSVVSAIFRRSEIESDMDEELRAHVQNRADDLERSGLSREGAERRARVEFGGYQKFKEESRETLGTHFLESLLQDVRFGLRMLRKSPGFTAAAVLTLALGLVANGVIFSLADAAAFRPLPIRDPNGLVRIFTSEKAGSEEYLYGRSSFPEFADLKAQSEGFSDIAAYGSRGAILDTNGERTLLYANWVSGNYFSLLGVRAVLGRTFTDEEVARRDAPLVVVLGYSLWKSHFGGDPQIVGKSINLNSQLWMVLGVAPREFRGLDSFLNPDVWIPKTLLPGAGSEIKDRGTRDEQMLARLKPGASLENAQAELNTIASQWARAYPKTNAGRKLTAEFEVQNRLAGRMAKLSRLILAIPGLVLLIACANVASLLLARAVTRRREIAVRLALGAGRARLIRQMLVEGSLLALLGAACAVVFSKWVINLLPTLVPTMSIPIGFDLRLDTRVLSFTLAAALISVLLFALAPALKASRADLTAVLKEQAAPVGYGTRRMTLRNVLVIGQMAISMMLLIGAGLLVRALWNLQAVDPGFNRKQNMLLMLVPPGLWEYDENHSRVLCRQIIERVEALPGVRQAGLVRFFPFSPNGGGANKTIFIPGMELAPNEDGKPIRYTVADPGYFRTIGARILQGRAFSDQDAPSISGVALINETMARSFWPHQNPIGQHLRVGGRNGRDCEVVGVVQDEKYNDLTEPPTPYLYLPLSQEMSGELTLVITTVGAPGPQASVVRQALRALDPRIAILSVLTLGEQMRFALYGLRVIAGLAATLGLFGLFLASVGLYGVVSYSVSQRTHEIGVRVALGAERRDIFRLVLGQGLRLTSIGVAIGLAAALALARLIGSFAYGVSPSDPMTFIVVALILAAVALLACYLPARRATRVDPIMALRCE